MGCITSKHNSPQRKPSRKGSFVKNPSRSNSSKIENLSRSKEVFDSLDTREADLSRSKHGFDRLDSAEVKPALVEKERYGSSKFYEGEIEKKQENIPEIGFQDPTDLKKVPSVVVHPGSGRVPKASELEQVAAGWPTWLVRVAGEALAGWVPRRASTFEKSDKIGQGTYSSVFKARDLVQNKIVALKKVRFDLKDLESVKFMAREIIILRRLDHPNVIKLEGLITAPTSCSLYLVFEYMEHDLVGIASLPGIKFSEPQVKCYMDQLLSGLDHCHSRGVLHRDIKGSNLLIDTNGVLKIADFGLATFFDPNNSVPLTSRVVTLWYRPPELLLGASHYGVGVDLWSAGCILGELYASKPILPGKTEVEQLHRIFKLCGSPSEEYWRKLKLTPSSVFKPVQQYRRRITETYKDFPHPVLSLMETLLSIDPENRGTAEESLKSEFFTTEPFACEPASLPKYPPSKEIDAKMREEAKSRCRAAGERVENQKLETRGSNEPLAHRSNASFAASTQKKQYPDPKSRSDIFNSYKGDKASGFPVNSSKPTQNSKDIVRKDSMPMERNVNKIYHSGPLVNNRKMGRSICLKEHIPSRTVASKATPEALSGLGAPGRVFSNADRQDRRNPPYAGLNQAETDRGSYYRSDSFGPQNEQNWNKIYMSGPLMVQPKKVDQMLEEHDRQLQEFARQARRNDKTKPGKV